MPRFAANVSMLLTEVPFLERFRLARDAGFEAVEFLFPYEHNAADVAEALKGNGLTLALFNFPAGDFSAGERGLASDPSRVDTFRESAELAMQYAQVLQPEKMNCLAGKVLPGVSRQDQLDTLIANLRYAAELAATHNVRLVMEPLNPFDGPGYLITTPDEGFAVIEHVNHPNLKVQYDIYHAQRTQGNMTSTLFARMPLIGHIQIADSPDRHEPGTGEINYPFVFQAIDNAGYDGWVSLEYKPRTNTAESLEWLNTMGFWT
ncbi:MAG: hydroxypyruvate isomerase family protein [Chloroflexota bacterium]|nr:hydroxypyruvate isomerase family protein [Chloroflexota bacterium]